MGRPKENSTPRKKRVISVTLNDDLLKAVQKEQKKKGYGSPAWTIRQALTERYKIKSKK